MDYEDEFADFVAGRWPTLVRAAVFLGAAPHEAEDLAQTTLVLCYRKWDRVRAADDRDAYVYRMLMNTLRSDRRTSWWRKRDLRDLPDQPVGDGSEAAAIADAVHRAMSSLSIEQQNVVVLRYFVQLTEAQTAAVLGIPAGTVKSRLSRSIAALSANHHLAEFAGGSR
ncbi:MAG: SigE family RNA polymerase sigma factor [Marmoricola sp.]